MGIEESTSQELYGIRSFCGDARQWRLRAPSVIQKKEMVLKHTFRIFHDDKMKNKHLCGLTAISYCLNKAVFQRKAVSPFSGFWYRPAPSLAMGDTRWPQKCWCIWTTWQVSQSRNILVNSCPKSGDPAFIISGWIDKWWNCPLYLYSTTLGLWARRVGMRVRVTNSW